MPHGGRRFIHIFFDQYYFKYSRRSERYNSKTLIEEHKRNFIRRGPQINFKGL